MLCSLGCYSVSGDFSHFNSIKEIKLRDVLVKSSLVRGKPRRRNDNTDGADLRFIPKGFQVLKAFNQQLTPKDNWHKFNVIKVKLCTGIGS